MKIFSTTPELQNHLKINHHSPRGFVPTMGALHQGHLSLVNIALRECPVVVTSIFVNPAQFNDKKDLERYPRTPGKDLEMLSGILRDRDAVFMPAEPEIYPENEVKEKWNFGNLDKVMEGVHRPGHFNGVAQVVSRLFDIVNPDIAYFGQKDFQQLVIIKDLVRQKGSKIKITPCPIVREPDGVAMSSRNVLLEPVLRQKAGVIFKTLAEASSMINSAGIGEIKEFVQKSIDSTPGFRLEYFEIVDDIELKPVLSQQEMQTGKRYYGCVAVRAGNVRLIDNVEFSCSVSKG